MQRSNSKQAKSITSHPLFPALVALWFGALFGLGSLAIRSALIEELVIAVRLDLLIPAAAPPLGLTARILIALALAAFGALLGAWFGRKLGEARLTRRQRRRDARMPEPAKPGMAIHDGAADADDDLVGSDDPRVAVRRRALALDEVERRFEVEEMAPLPGGMPQIFAVAEAGIAPIDPPDHLASPAEPLELAQFAAPAERDPEPVEPSVTIDHPDCHPASIAPAAALGQNILPVEVRPEPTIRPDPAPRMTSGFATPQAVPLFALHEAGQVAPVALDQPAPPPPAPVDPDAPLPDLARRLAEAMQRRRAARSGPSVDPRPTGPLPNAFRSPMPAESAPEGEDLVLPSLLPPRLDLVTRAAAEDAPQPVEPFAVPPAPMALPAALRPLAPDEFDTAEALPAALDHLLPPRRLVIPPVAQAAILADEAGDDADEALASDEDRFSSLLKVAPRVEHPGNPFVRIEEPAAPAGDVEPMVIFPGQIAGDRPFDPAGARVAVTATSAIPAHDHDETERALKLALASLQRMSGAA